MAPAAALLVTGLLVGWLAANFPKAPIGPRYLGAGNEAPRAGGTFIFSAGSNIHTLDPHFAYDTLSTAACRLLYDGLLDYDYDGNMIPSLAAELPEISDAGRIFRFTLRDGIKFHNGREITAEDISWSLHRLLSERVGSPGYPFFKSIEGAPAYHPTKPSSTHSPCRSLTRSRENTSRRSKKPKGAPPSDGTRSDRGPLRSRVGSAAFKSSSSASKHIGTLSRGRTE
ncbi:MAG: hypothetical protein JRF54_16185 [Deltaproteobacteria bacterium]|nr:hypothetical protein [Deltaproteobacteria bacterium]